MSGLSEEPTRVSGVFTLLCNDGDGPDGSTWYHLLDPFGHPIGDCAWPQPLEELARDLRGEVRRVTRGQEGPGQSLGLPNLSPEYELPDLDERAADWLEGELFEGPLPVRVVERRARMAGVSPQRLTTAAKALAVEKHRVWGRRTTSARRYRGSFGVWSLPGSFDRDLAVARAETVGVELAVVPAALALGESGFLPWELSPEDVMPDEIGSNGNGRSPVMTDETLVFPDGETMQVKEDGVVEMCKIDGCPMRATGKASFSGLCDVHTSEEAARRNRKAAANRKAKTVPPSEAVVVDDTTRELLGEELHPVEKFRRAVEKRDRESGRLPTLSEVAREIEDLRDQRDELDRLITERVDSLVELARQQ